MELKTIFSNFVFLFNSQQVKWNFRNMPLDVRLQLNVELALNVRLTLDIELPLDVGIPPDVYKHYTWGFTHLWKSNIKRSFKPNSTAANLLVVDNKLSLVIIPQLSPSDGVMTSSLST